MIYSRSIRKRFLLLFVGLVFIVFFQVSFSNIVYADKISDNWIYDLSSADISVIVGSTITLENPSKISSVFVNLSFIPLDSYRQDIVSYDLKSGRFNADAIEYVWQKPKQQTLVYGFESVIHTDAKLKKIDFVKFPLDKKSISEQNLEKYVEPTEYIDSDSSDIISTASYLVSGKDDLFDAVFTLATFVANNTVYDLALSNTVKKGSWILKNKRGVCSEYSTLLASLLRSVGIPVRFVSGVAYSNIDSVKGFGPHAWVEVYFPGTGWIPFDSTYGEYGWIDSTHIALKKSLDSNSASTKFQWVGSGSEIKTYDLDIVANLVSKGPSLDDPVAIKSSILHNKVSFGSYDLYKVTLTNLYDTYTTTTITLSETDGIDILGNNRVPVFLRPHESKDLFWVIKVSDKLDKGYLYTFQIGAYARSGENDTSKFIVKDGYTYYSLDNILERLSSSDTPKTSNSSLELSCYADLSKEKMSKKQPSNQNTNKEFYIDQNIDIICKVTNKGNTFLKNIQVCFEEDDACKYLDLGITRSTNLKFVYVPNSTGSFEFMVKASTKDISSRDFVDINIFNRPRVIIKNITYPKTTGYKDFKIGFAIDKSSSVPKDVNIELLSKKIHEVWNLRELKGKVSYVIDINIDSISYGKNDFLIVVRYKDSYGNNYCKDSSFSINLENLDFFERIFAFVSDVFSKKYVVRGC